MQKKKLVLPETAVYNVVAVYRERGNYLQRIEQFEKAIQAYDEALRWNNSDVRSLLGRSLARARATHYVGSLQDAAKAAELEPDNITTLEIRAHTYYEKCAFESSLLLAHRGKRQRRYPAHLAECIRHAEETIRECVDKSAEKVLSDVDKFPKGSFLTSLENYDSTTVQPRRGKMQPLPTQQVKEMSRIEKQRTEQISRLMASKYLERMAHDKYFLIALSKDERLASANRQGSKKLQELANKALADLEKRQAVLRTRRPLYAARASEEEARARLSNTYKERLLQSQRQNETDARRLVQSAADMYDKHDTVKCLELAEFALEQISRKSVNLLPKKEKLLQKLYDIIANAFLYEKRVNDKMSESDREMRALVLLGMNLSREPSADSLLRARPIPPLDYKGRLRALERALTQSARAGERCYVLHELSRIHLNTKQMPRATFYALKCQSEARTASPIWLLNATFLLARCHILQNNRSEGRATLLEGTALARCLEYDEVAAFFDVCANVSIIFEYSDVAESLEKREQAMVSLMQDDDLKSQAKHLFRRMSTVPVSRRFSIMPGVRAEESEKPTAGGRRMSIMPRTEQPTRISQKSRHPLGLQDFDYL